MDSGHRCSKSLQISLPTAGSPPVQQRRDIRYMEVPSSRRGRESSPDRAKILCMQQQPKHHKPIRKLQVVYYLTRNGLLEHPHYMEVSHFAHRPLRLSDVLNRLTVLRGKGMPTLYSWSSKRSYKNGYVWNDLAENDVLYPADGAEYVLKGSELVNGDSEKFEQHHVSGRQLIQDSSYILQPKRSPLTPRQLRQELPGERVKPSNYEDHEEYQEEEDEYETSYTSSTTPRSRCSRGVSTEELDDQEPPHNQQQPEQTQKKPAESTHPDSAPPPSISSILSREKLVQTESDSKNASIRFEDGDPVDVKSVRSRNSVLLQLIACGSNLAVAKAKNNVGSFERTSPHCNMVVVKKCGGGGNNGSLLKGVVCKSAIKIAEDEDMISCMSENPRFGNLQSEEKEYFSGSLVESMSKDRVEVDHQTVLKKSNSYNEERSCKEGLGEEAVDEKKWEKRSECEGILKGKCIPRKKSSSSSKKN